MKQTLYSTYNFKLELKMFYQNKPHAGPRNHPGSPQCKDGDPTPLPQKGGTALPPIFGPCLL